MNEKTTKRKVYERSKKVSPRGITDRDRDALEVIFRYDYISATHLKSIVFANDKKNIVFNRRMRKLFDLGLVGLKPFFELADPYHPHAARLTSRVYYLEADGVRYLRKDVPLSRYYKRDKIRSSSVNHLHNTNRFVATVERACRDNGIVVADHRNEFVLKADYDYVDIEIKVKNRPKKVTRSVIADTYLGLQNPETENVTGLLIELDTGEEKLGVIAEKTLRYRSYFNANDPRRLPEKRFGSRNIPVVFVTLSGKRRVANMVKVIEDAGGTPRFYVASIDEITPENVLYEPIWSVATKSKRQPLFTL